MASQRVEGIRAAAAFARERWSAAIIRSRAKQIIQGDRDADDKVDWLLLDLPTGERIVADLEHFASVEETREMLHPAPCLRLRVEVSSKGTDALTIRTLEGGMQGRLTAALREAGIHEGDTIEVRKVPG